MALRGHAAKISLRVIWQVWTDLPRYWATLLRSSVIGCWLGITPGGAIAASFMGYNLAKRFSKDPESFGKGRIEGVFLDRLPGPVVDQVSPADRSRRVPVSAPR